jgi:hypothetical protein
MASTKTRTRSTPSKRTATNGNKTTKRATPKTANEALLIAWQHDYETRHKQTKKRA